MSSKVTVLVVEDEEIERQAVEIMLKYNCQEVDTVLSAANGIEALEVFRQERPDIVLMDINLPGANGLEVIRQMKLISAQSRYVILSAYNKFEYAQEAIRLDIVDFLIKPIQSADLQNLILKMAKEISEASAMSQHAKNQMEKYQTIRPLLENDCVYTVASLREATPISTIFDFLQMELASGCVMVARGDSCTLQFIQTIRKRLQIMELECLGDMINELCVLVVLSKKQMQTRQLKDILNYIFNTLPMTNAYVGVGTITEPDDNLKRSFNQAVFAMQYAEHKEITTVFFEELKNSETPELLNIQAEAAEISRRIFAGDEQEILSLLDVFFTTMQLNMTKEEIISNANWLYSSVTSELMEAGIPSVLFETKKMRKCQDVTEMKNLMITNLTAIAETQKEQMPAKGSQSIHAVLRIIHTQYMKNITMESVARQMNYTPYYLSRIFKKHTGGTFSEYLNTFRIEQAKKMIREGELSIKEIASATGFNSQGYFAKIFKKYTGVSPSDFQ